VVNTLDAIQRNDETYAATVLFLGALKSVVAKAKATPGPVLLTPWESRAIEAVEAVTGLELLVPETFEDAVAATVERARHAVRGPAGTFIPAGTSEHRAEDGTVVRWSHTGSVHTRVAGGR
jgi:hypothetical protein